MKINRLPAFTIAELIVAMIISTVLIMALYAVLSNTGTLFGTALAQSYREVQALEFVEILQSDMMHADSITGDRSQLLMYTQDNSFMYDIQDSIVIRTHDRVTDSFYVYAADISCRYHPELTEYVVQLSFVLPQLLGDDTIAVAKSYSRAQVFNARIRQ